MWVLHGQDSRVYVCGFCMKRTAGCTYVGLRGPDSREYICGFAWTG
jgi:hypothetical protein